MPISKVFSDGDDLPDEDIDTSEIPELGASFFSRAILTRPGESLIDKVQATRRRVPSVSVNYARNGASTRANSLGMRPMQERVYERRGEPYLLIKSPPASGKSRALMFVALDKLANQGLKQAIIVVPERSIGASFNDEPLTPLRLLGGLACCAPKWNLLQRARLRQWRQGEIRLRAFLESDDKVLVCTHATFRFAVDEYGIEAFDGRLIAVDEFHHVSEQPRQQARRCISASSSRGGDKVHLVAMTGSYFRGDAEAVLAPAGRGPKFRDRHLYLLRAAQRLRVSQAARHRLLLLQWPTPTCRRHPERCSTPTEKTIIHIP